ncbi:WD40 repeat-like protein [Panus rudis PR-1116 ss-1]|nr:WD40 repeat-like protein [Panus rudis PR-1116 ss-1]
MVVMGEPTTLAVHRCRFVDFTPSAITALAFPPLPLPSAAKEKRKRRKNVSDNSKKVQFGTLAIGRANGNIELCEWSGDKGHLQAPQAWVVKKTLVGPYGSKVDSLAFTIRYPDQVGTDELPSWSNLRLFSAGGGNELAEWDIEKGCIRRTIASNGGSIWSISVNPSGTTLALGCEDGSIRLLSLEYDTLSHLRRLDRVKARILSLSWGPPVPRNHRNNPSEERGAAEAPDTESSDEEEEEWADSWIVAGCSDSSVRKWDLKTGRVLDKMAADRSKGERTLVWAVGVLGDGTIISGDSLGMVKFWDSRTCTQIHSFPAHGADVLCLAISPEGSAVYSSGVDQKVVQFTVIKAHTSQPQSSLLSRSSPSRWIQSSARRMHSHDVRALAIWPPHTPLPPSHSRRFPIDLAPILASGGLDMSVVLTPAALPNATGVAKVVNPLMTSTVATFEDAYHRRMAYSTAPFGSTGVKVAKSARLVMCMKDSGLKIWRVKPRKNVSNDEDIAVNGEVEGNDSRDGGWDNVLEMDLNVHTNLVASAISDDGNWISVSDWYETKLFRLEHLKNGHLKPHRIRNFSSILETPSPESSTGSSSLTFSPDSRKLILATAMSAHVIIVDLGGTADDQRPRVLRRFDQHRMKDVKVVKGRRRAARQDEDVDMDEEREDRPQENEDSSEEEVEDDTNATVTRMAVSPDGQWLATVDDRCRTHVFNLDSIQHHCVLPSLPHPIHAISFMVSSPSVLTLALANNTIQIYDVESRTFPAWSRPLTSSLPPRFTTLHDPVIGVAFDPDANDKNKKMTALFWGSTWICKVILDQGMYGYGGYDKKRRRDGRKFMHRPPPITNGEDGQQQPAQNFKMVTQYRPILCVDFLGPGELVVVERPLVDVLSRLPPAFFKPKYGAS